MKFVAYLFSLILLIQGLVLSFSDYMYGVRMLIESNFKNIFLSFVLSFLCFIYAKSIKKRRYSKCPKCKESFSYLELENGICPTCNVETIDIT